MFPGASYMNGPGSNNADDLGFTYVEEAGLEVKIFHKGRFATVLRNLAATKFLAEMLNSPFADQQQIMARVTGNYKRGNERSARKHPRNR
jgi:hypothetical protein